MATALPVPTQRTQAGGSRVRAVPLSATLVVVAVLVLLGSLAAVSGHWAVALVLALLFVAGTGVLAVGGEEPLTARQATGIGLVHLAAGLLLVV